MNLKKCFAVSAAIATMLSAISITASAGKVGSDEFYDANATCAYKIIDGNAIITNVTTAGKYFDIPDTIDYQIEGEDGELETLTAPVVGVDDYAFALCEDLEAVYVPDTFTLENTGNVAFLTSSAVMNFMDNELGSAATVNDVIRYVAEKANYKNGNFTDDDLADVAVKLENKLSMVDISTANTVEGKIMTLLMNVDKMNLNPDLYNSFNIWISTITYNDFTLCAYESATAVKEYAMGREFLKMKFAEVLAADFVQGDANGDGKFNVRDAAYVAANVAKGVEINPLENPAADYNKDGKVNVRDAAAMARVLSAAK